MNKIANRLFGSILIFGGISIWANPVFYSSQFGTTFDFSEIRWIFGGGLIVLGIISIWSSFSKKAIEADKKAKDDNKILMCIKCVKPYYKKDCPNLRCPECQTELEDLSGFYERHPDLKDKK